MKNRTILIYPLMALMAPFIAGAQDIPNISVDKKLFPNIQKMDEMIKVQTRLEQKYPEFEKMFVDYKNKMTVSLNGTLEEQLTIIQTMVSSVRNAEETIIPFVDKTLKIFSPYKNEDNFRMIYTDLYSKTEEEVSAIKDNAKRREVESELTYSYRNYPRTNYDYFLSQRNKIDEIKNETFSKIISRVESRMSMVSYRKGKDLIDIMSGTKTALNALNDFNPNAEQKKQIADWLLKVDETTKSRLQDLEKGRDSTKFPARYSGGNTPGNALNLEKMMKEFLEKSSYDGGKHKYKVLKIALASSWVEVKKILNPDETDYYQIDFYAAYKHHADADFIRLVYVTGKTDGTNKAKFAKYSIGSYGEMREKNLD